MIDTKIETVHRRSQASSSRPIGNNAKTIRSPSASSITCRKRARAAHVAKTLATDAVQEAQALHTTQRGVPDLLERCVPHVLDSHVSTETERHAWVDNARRLEQSSYSYGPNVVSYPVALSPGSTSDSSDTESAPQRSSTPQHLRVEDAANQSADPSCQQAAKLKHSNLKVAGAEQVRDLKYRDTGAAKRVARVRGRPAFAAASCAKTPGHSKAVGAHTKQHNYYDVQSRERASTPEHHQPSSYASQAELLGSVGQGLTQTVPAEGSNQEGVKKKPASATRRNSHSQQSQMLRLLLVVSLMLFAGAVAAPLFSGALSAVLRGRQMGALRSPYTSSPPGVSEQMYKMYQSTSADTSHEQGASAGHRLSPLGATNIRGASRSLHKAATAATASAVAALPPSSRSLLYNLRAVSDRMGLVPRRGHSSVLPPLGATSGMMSGGASTSEPPALAQGELAWIAGAAVRVLVVLGEDGGVSSPFKGATWGEVMSHMGKRLDWTDPSFQSLVVTEQQLIGQGTGRGGDNNYAVLDQLLGTGCQILLGVGVTDPGVISHLEKLAIRGQLPPTRLFLDSLGSTSRGSEGKQSNNALNKLTEFGGWKPLSDNGVVASLASKLPLTPQNQAVTVWSMVQDLWARHTSDDLLLAVLVLVNQYITPVKEVYMTTKGFDPGAFLCMIRHCSQEIVSCVNNPTCKTALDCLQACSFNDQVCQYRCIVSYETPQLEAFSLCILQKHNCRGLSAEAPTRPDPAPMATFRGQALTHEVAEDMFIGWLNPAATGAGVMHHAASEQQSGAHDTTAAGSVTPGSKQQPGGSTTSAPSPAPPALAFSWLIAAGKNAAYDAFPCQHQLFSRGKNKGVLWYEPVFKVITLEGTEVWRRRKYRVRRASVPGSFYFSVLDNGVTSSEYWRILDCDDSLEWCLFYYSGAASTAGLAYSGAVLGTRDGSYPAQPEAQERLNKALRAAGIEPWELSFANNSNCEGAPLGGLAGYV